MIRIMRYVSKPGSYLRVSNSQGGSPGTERGTRAGGVCCILGSGEEGLARIGLRSRPARRRSLQRRGSRSRQAGLCPCAMHELRRDDQRGGLGRRHPLGLALLCPAAREHISAAPEHAAGAGVGRPLPGSGCELDEARLRRPDHGRSGAALDEHRPPYVSDLVRHHAAKSLRRTDLLERRRWRSLADQPVGGLPRPGRGEAAGGSAASLRTEPIRLSARRLLLRKHDRHRSEQPVVLQVARWRSELRLHRRFSRSGAAGGLQGGSPLAPRGRRARRGALLPNRAVRSPGRRDQPRRGRELAVPPDRRHRARGHLHIRDRRRLHGATSTSPGGAPAPSRT